MATRSKFIAIGALYPNATSVYPDKYSTFASNDVWDGIVLVFPDSGTRDGTTGFIDVPDDYVGAPVFIPLWTSVVTTGNVVWDLDYRSVGGDDAESMDQAGTQEALTVTDAAPSAANNLLRPQMAATAGNLAAGDILELELFRDSGNASDTMASSALLFGLLFQYSDQ